MSFKKDKVSRSAKLAVKFSLIERLGFRILLTLFLIILRSFRIWIVWRIKTDAPCYFFLRENVIGEQLLLFDINERVINIYCRLVHPKLLARVGERPQLITCMSSQRHFLSLFRQLLLHRKVFLLQLIRCEGETIEGFLVLLILWLGLDDAESLEAILCKVAALWV